MEPVGFGLIGYGAWGSHYASALARIPGAKLVAVAAHSENTCSKVRAELSGVPIYTDYSDLLRRENVDVVAVVVPPHLHYEVGKAVLESGRHLLLEKPMALRLDHCDQLIALARNKNRLLGIGHEMRLSPLWGKLKTMIDEGAIGRPLYGLVELWRRPYRQGSEGWRYDINRVGNWILEEPIHFFDLARWYLAGAGDPASVYARANSRQPGHPELQDNFSAILNFPSGAYFVLSQTLAAFEHHLAVKITGDGGALWAAWSGEMDRTFHPSLSLKYSDGREQTEIPIAWTAGEVFELQEQLAMMVEAVRNRRPLAANGEDGKWSVALCQAAQRSVEKEAPVLVQEFMGGKSSSSRHE
jgi:myo-inositol 2-dehydrogenase/D-chiro-inositol 1-dehydrogenase